MPCIVDTPEDQARDLVVENARLKGALCAAIRTLFELRGQVSGFAPVTGLRNGYALIDMTDSGISSRWLRDWWHAHYDQDVARREQEAAEAQLQQLRNQALAKLTDAERTALGHPPLPTTRTASAALPGRRNQGMPGGDV